MQIFRRHSRCPGLKLPARNGHLACAFRQRCAAEGLTGVYIGPPRLAAALIESAAIDYCFHYLAPKYLCDASAVGMGSARATQTMDAAIQLTNLRRATLATTAWCADFLNHL